MAKEDFCFTYYDGDAARDMQHMDRLCRGAYNDLVIMQRKVGRLSMEHIKAVLGSDFEKCWPPLSYILKTEEGKYFIEWVENSVQKMKKNSEKNRENIQKYWDEKKKCGTTNEIRSNKKTIRTYKKNDTNVIPLENGYGYGYIGEKEEGVIGEEEKTFHTGIYSTEISKDLKLDELQILQTVEFIRIICQKTLSPPEVEEHFEAFKIQNLSKKQWYADTSELVTHFRNALKLEFKNHGTHQQTATTSKNRNSEKRGTSTDRIEALKNW